MTDRLQAWIKLIMAALALIAIWCILLPCIGQLPWVRNHIQTMQEKRIHPDAMYYTELESNDPDETGLETLHTDSSIPTR